MLRETTNQLDSLFYPKSVAVVGASPSKNGRANQWINGYIKLGFQGKIFPVHPSAETILGFKSYPSVRDIPEEVDLVIFSVPFAVVLQVMQDCVEKGVKYVHLFTAGFSETGQEDQADLERQLLEIAQKGGVRLIGPNCMGLYCPESGLTWSEDFPKTAGPVGFVSQSGQLASHFIWDGAMDGIQFSKVISFGNACDLQSHDFLNYLGQDEKTEILGSYIEGLKDGRAFFEFARNITRKKPFVVWKGGQTEGGARATQSHTASIAGSQKIWQSLCQQTGIVSVDSMEELISTTVALKKMPLPRGTNVALVGGAGGGSVTMTDAAEKEGLKVPHLAEETQRKLAEFIPISGNSVRNPLDIGFSNVYRDENDFVRLFKLLNDDPIINAVIFFRGLRRGRGSRKDMNLLTSLMLKGMEVIEKPVYIVLPGNRTLEGEALREEAQDKYNNIGLPTFPSFTLAARVISNLSQYYNYLFAHGF
ncbi:MAG: CoA-binding protein [Deltaproteobacteria bacterium]|nr:CoA-binding protein [Deltaproteobacteria bacterium]MBW2051157.1 CoA-binding protein [Deltaproteobacteria bacterium]MBW2140017.1 CoA-binding protein [Deltaproteobacteria bacterium]